VISEDNVMDEDDDKYAFPDRMMLFRRDRKMTMGDYFVHDPSDWHWYVREELYKAQVAEVARLRTALKLIVDSDDAASELFTNDRDRADNFADHARAALATYQQKREGGE